MDCGLDTAKVPGQYYMVHDAVWREAVPDMAGVLCLRCLQHRLRRGLTEADFEATPLEMMARFAQAPPPADRGLVDDRAVPPGTPRTPHPAPVGCVGARHLQGATSEERESVMVTVLEVLDKHRNSR
jgi:hypothetical protein